MLPCALPNVITMKATSSPSSSTPLKQTTNPAQSNPPSATAPAPPIAAARPRFVAAMNGTRGSRSARVEVNGAEIAAGIARTKETIPTAFAPPTW
jgi:hypothetical protein